MKRCAVGWVLGLLIPLHFVLVSCAQAQDVGASSLPTEDQQQTASPPAEQKPKYHRRFPIGIDRIPQEDREKIPLPFGIGLNYFGSTEKYLFSSASVAINGQPIPSQMMLLDSLTTIQDSTTVRIDGWLLPCLNLHLVSGTFTGKTRNIKAAMVGQQIPLPREIPFGGTNVGVGATLAGGCKSLFASYDWNIAWAKVDLARGRIPTITQGLRLGAQFGRPGAQGVIYVGGFREDVSGSVEGSISLQGVGKFDYKVTVVPERAWNYVVGANVELRRHWLISLEHGFGKRTHDLVSITGRF